jgi:hypothetical protein
MDISRRGFLKLMAATPVAIALPAQAKLWVPPHIDVERDVVELLRPVVDASAAGDLICGWLLADEFQPADVDWMFPTLAADAYRYFPDGCALMALRRRDILTRRPGAGKRMQRFLWRGTGSPVEGAALQIAAAWNSRSQLLEEGYPHGGLDMASDFEIDEGSS